MSKPLVSLHGGSPAEGAVARLDAPALRKGPADALVHGWISQRGSSPLIIERAQGIYLWDESGRRYADFCAGQISVNVGYGHPRVVASIREQLGKAAYVSPAFATAPEHRLANMIVDCAPPGLSHVFFTNTGAEGVETAVKIARAVTGRSKIYSAWRSYHGATAGASAVSGDPRRLYAEPTAGAVKFHYPSCYECPFGQTGPETCGFPCLSALRNQILFEGPETIAAVLVEPVVGTSGVFVPPPEFLPELRRLCDEHGMLLIFDETITGWGRTGHWFACEAFGTVPDLLVTAKGITSGYVPLGAVLMTDALYDAFLDRPFVAGSTTEGHALGCAAAIANLQIYSDEGLIERSASSGRWLLTALEGLKSHHRCVGDVRGMGLLACVQLTSERSVRAPLAGYRDAQGNVAAQITKLLLERGIFMIARWDFIFVAPPLNVTEDELILSIDVLDEVLSIVDARI